MRDFALIGRSLGHSLSADYFNRKFAALGIGAHYSLIPLPSLDGLRQMIDEMPSLEGFNVTIPYKEEIIPMLDCLSDEAARIGAVNTVKITRTDKGTILCGYNTDVVGFSDSILPFRNIPGEALVCGTGGAMKAVAYVLQAQGRRFTVVSRSAGKADITYSEITEELMDRCRLIINATPAGTWPDTESRLPLPYNLITGRHVAVDLVYNPLVTSFLSEALARGAVGRNGLTMLYSQAEAAWKIWNAENS